jgi:signal transduction histidine kinase
LLSTLFAYVCALGGTLEVLSTPGHGTTVIASETTVALAGETA